MSSRGWKAKSEVFELALAIRPALPTSSLGRASYAGDTGAAVLTLAKLVCKAAAAIDHFADVADVAG